MGVAATYGEADLKIHVNVGLRRISLVVCIVRMILTLWTVDSGRLGQAEAIIRIREPGH